MYTDGQESKEFIAVRLPVTFNYAAGRVASRFFQDLRNERKIMGKRCGNCDRVLVPPRLFCPFCFCDTAEWVEVSREGVLEQFTVVHCQAKHYPFPPPVIYGLIHLDGADTQLLHVISEVKIEQVRKGLRVEACFNPVATVPMFYISHFRPG